MADKKTNQGQLVKGLAAARKRTSRPCAAWAWQRIHDTRGTAATRPEVRGMITRSRGSTCS